MQRVPSTEWYPTQQKEQEIFNLYDPDEDVFELDDTSVPEHQQSLESWKNLATKNTSVKYFLIAKTPEWLYPHPPGADDEWVRANYQGELTELERKMLIDLLTALRLTSLNYLPEELKCTLKASTGDCLSDQEYYSLNDQPPPATRFFVKYPFTDTCDEFITTVESVSMVKPLGNIGYFERGTDVEDFESMRRQVGSKYETDYDRYYHRSQLSKLQGHDRIIRDYILLSFHIQGLHVHGSCDIFKSDNGLWYLGFSDGENGYARVDVRGPLRWNDARRLKFAYFSYKNFWDFEHDENRKSKGKPPLHEFLARQPNQPPPKPAIQHVMHHAPHQNGNVAMSKPIPSVPDVYTSPLDTVHENRSQQFRSQLPVKTIQPLQQNGIPQRRNAPLQNGNTVEHVARQPAMNGTPFHSQVHLQNGVVKRTVPAIPQGPILNGTAPRAAQRPPVMSVSQRQMYNAAAAQQLRAQQGPVRQQMVNGRVAINGQPGLLQQNGQQIVRTTTVTRRPITQAGSANNGTQQPTLSTRMVTIKTLPDGSRKTVTYINKPGSSGHGTTIMNGQRSSAATAVQASHLQSNTVLNNGLQQRRVAASNEIIEIPPAKRVRLADNVQPQSASQNIPTQFVPYNPKPVSSSANRMSASSLSSMQATFAQRPQHRLKEQGQQPSTVNQGNSLYEPAVATFSASVPGREQGNQILVPGVKRRRVLILAPLQNGIAKQEVNDVISTPSTSAELATPSHLIQPVKYQVVNKTDLVETKPEAIPPVVQPKPKGRRGGRAKVIKEEVVQPGLLSDVSQPSTSQLPTTQPQTLGPESERPRRERKGTSWRPREEREYMTFDEPRRYKWNANNKRQTKMEQMQEIVKMKGKPRGRTHKNIDKDIEKDVTALMDAVLDEVDREIDPDYYDRIVEDVMEELLDGAEKISNRKRGRKKKETRYLGCKAKIHKAEDGLPVSPKTEKKPKANLYVPQEIIIPQAINQAVKEVMDSMLNELSSADEPTVPTPAIVNVSVEEKPPAAKTHVEEKPVNAQSKSEEKLPSIQTTMVRHLPAVAGPSYMHVHVDHKQELGPIIIVGSPPQPKIEKPRGPDISIFQENRKSLEKKMEEAKLVGSRSQDAAVSSATLDSALKALKIEPKPNQEASNATETKKDVQPPTVQTAVPAVLPGSSNKNAEVAAESSKPKPEQKDRLPTTPEKEDKPRRKRRKRLLFTQTKKRKVQFQTVVQEMQQLQKSQETAQPAQPAPATRGRKKKNVEVKVEEPKPTPQTPNQNSSWDAINKFNFWKKQPDVAAAVVPTTSSAHINGSEPLKQTNTILPNVEKKEEIVSLDQPTAKRTSAEVTRDSVKDPHHRLINGTQTISLPNGMTPMKSLDLKTPALGQKKVLSPLTVQVPQSIVSTKDKREKGSVTPGSKSSEVLTSKTNELVRASPAAEKRMQRRSVSMTRSAPRVLTEEDHQAIKNCMQAVINNVVMADNMDRIASSYLRRNANRRTSLPDMTAMLLSKSSNSLGFNKNPTSTNEFASPNPLKYLGHVKAPEKKLLKTEYPLLPPKITPTEKPQTGIREQLQFQRRVHFRNANLFANSPDMETPRRRRERLHLSGDKSDIADENKKTEGSENVEECAEKKQPDPMTYLGHIKAPETGQSANTENFALTPAKPAPTEEKECGLNAQLEFQRKVHFDKDTFNSQNVPHSLVYQAIVNKQPFKLKNEQDKSDDELSESGSSRRSESPETEPIHTDSEEDEDGSSNSSDSVNFSARSHKLRHLEYVQSLLRREEAFGTAPTILSEYSHIVTPKKDVILTVEEKPLILLDFIEHDPDVVYVVERMLCDVVRREEQDHIAPEVEKIKLELKSSCASMIFSENTCYKTSPDIKRLPERKQEPEPLTQTKIDTSAGKDVGVIKDLVDDLAVQCDVNELMDDVLSQCEVNEKRENARIKEEIKTLVNEMTLTCAEIIPCMNWLIGQVVLNERLAHIKGCVQPLRNVDIVTAEPLNRNKSPDSGISSTSDHGTDSSEEPSSPKLPLTVPDTIVVSIRQRRSTWRKNSESVYSEECASQAGSCIEGSLEELCLSQKTETQSEMLQHLSTDLHSLTVNEGLLHTAAWIEASAAVHTVDNNPFASDLTKYRTTIVEEELVMGDSPLIRTVHEEIVIDDHSPASLVIVEESELPGDNIMRQLAAIVKSRETTPIPSNPETPVKTSAVIEEPVQTTIEHDGDYIMRELADIAMSREQTPAPESKPQEKSLLSRTFVDIMETASREKSFQTFADFLKKSEKATQKVTPKAAEKPETKQKKKKMTVLETIAAAEKDCMQELDDILRTRENTPEPIAVLEPAKTEPEVVTVNIEEPMNVAEVCEVVSEEQCFQEIDDILRTPEYVSEDVEPKSQDLFDDYDITVQDEVTLTDCPIDVSSLKVASKEEPVQLEKQKAPIPHIAQVSFPISSTPPPKDDSPLTIIFDDMSDEEEDHQRTQLEAVAHNLQSSMSYTPTIVRNMQSLTPETSPIMPSVSSFLNQTMEIISSPISAGSFTEHPSFVIEDANVVPEKKKVISAADRALTRRNLREANCDELYKFAFEDGDEELSDEGPDEDEIYENSNMSSPWEQKEQIRPEAQQPFNAAFNMGNATADFKQNILSQGPSTSKVEDPIERTEQAASKSAHGMQKLLLRLGWFTRQTRIIDALVPEVRCFVSKSEGDEVIYDVNLNHHIDLLSTVKLKDGRSISRDIIAFMRKLVKIWSMFDTSPFYPDECPLKLKNIEMIITDKKPKIEHNQPFAFKKLTQLQSVLAKMPLKETCAIGLGIKTPEYQVMLRIAAIYSLTLKINKNEIHTRDHREEYHNCAMAINLPHQYEELLKPIFTKYRQNHMEATRPDMDIDNGKPKIMVGSIYTVPVGTAETDPIKPDETFKTEILDQHWTHVSKRTDSSSLFRKQKCKVRDRYEVELQNGRMFVDAEEPLVATSLVHTCISGTFAIWYNRFKDILYLVDSEYYWCEDDYSGDPNSNPFSKARKNYNIPQRHGSFGDDSAYGYKPRSRAAKARGAGTYGTQPDQYECDTLLLLGMMKNTKPGLVFVTPKLFASDYPSIDFVRQNTCAIPMVNVITVLTGEIRFVKLMLNSMLDGLQLQLRSATEEIAAMYRAQVLFMRLLGNVWMFNILDTIKSLWNPVSCLMWNTPLKQEKLKQKAMDMIETCKRELLDPVKVLHHFEPQGRFTCPLDYRKAAMKQLSKIMIPEAMLNKYDVLIPWQETITTDSVENIGYQINEIALELNQLSLGANEDLCLLLSQLNLTPSGYEEMTGLDTQNKFAHPICQFAVPRMIEEIQMEVKNEKSNERYLKSLDWRTATTASVQLVQNAIAELLQEEQVDAVDNILNAREHWRYNQRECGADYISPDIVSIQFSNSERNYRMISAPRDHERPASVDTELAIEEVTHALSAAVLIENNGQEEDASASTHRTVEHLNDDNDSTSASDSGESIADDISLPSATTATVPKTDSGVGSLGSRASGSVSERFPAQAVSVISGATLPSIESQESKLSDASRLFSLPSIPDVKKTITASGPQTQLKPSTNLTTIHSEARTSIRKQFERDPFFKTPFKPVPKGVMDYRPQKYHDEHPSEHKPGTSLTVEESTIPLEDSLFAVINETRKAADATQMEPLPKKKSGIKRPTFPQLSPANDEKATAKKEIGDGSTTSLMNVFAACSVVDNDKEGASISKDSSDGTNAKDVAHELANMSIQPDTFTLEQQPSTSSVDGKRVPHVLKIATSPIMGQPGWQFTITRDVPQPSLQDINAFDRRVQERQRELDNETPVERQIPLCGTEDEKEDYSKWLRNIVDNAEKEKRRIGRVCEAEKVFRKRQIERQTGAGDHLGPVRPTSAPGWIGSSISEHHDEAYDLGLARYNRDIKNGGPPMNTVNVINVRPAVAETYISRNNTPASIAPFDMEPSLLEELVPTTTRLSLQKQRKTEVEKSRPKHRVPPSVDETAKNYGSTNATTSQQELSSSSADEFDDDETFF